MTAELLSHDLRSMSLGETAPGHYAGEVTPWPRPGWSTLEVRVEHAGDRFVRSVALEIGAPVESVP